MIKRIDFGQRVAGEKASKPDEFITKSQLTKPNGNPLDVAANGDLIVPAATSDHLVLADAGVSTDTPGSLIDKIIGANNKVVVSTDISDPYDVQLLIGINPSNIDVNELADSEGLLGGGSITPTRFDLLSYKNTEVVFATMPIADNSNVSGIVYATLYGTANTNGAASAIGVIQFSASKATTNSVEVSPLNYYITSGVQNIYVDFSFSGTISGNTLQLKVTADYTLYNGDTINEFYMDYIVLPIANGIEVTASTNVLIEPITSYNAVPINRFVEADGRLCRAGSYGMGVSTNAVTGAGQTIQLAIAGIAYIETAVDVTVGMDLCSNGSGQAVPYESGYLNCGLALESVTAGNLCKIKLR